jgi:signal transduction histidine kinase
MASEDSGVVRSIVLIDDDSDFLHVLRKRLQSQRAEYAPTGPVEIHTFSDPVEALVNLPANGICVVIIDFNMPGGTGLEWMPKLMKADVGPVILLTNQNDANVAAEAFRAGAADYVAKADVMSDDKRLGRAIREAVHRYRLEARNNLLTRQLKLLNVELEAKNKRLRELTETAHQFVDDVAHDFRTPLTVIEQYASIVAEGMSGPVTDGQRDHLAIITEATHDMAEMVDDFLDSSRLRARALSIQRQSHAAQELFDSVASMLAVRAKSKRLSMEYTVAEDVAPFFGDLSKAGRVLTNLAVNAIKVTPAGCSLHVWVKPTETGDVRIGVTDEGPGIKPDDLKIIFQRFKQIEEPQLTGTKGFGLGLSIVKQLTWLNLGSIEVESEVGKGSTFSFTLPADDLRRILACYLESVRSIDEEGDVRMLRITSRGKSSDISMLQRLISTFCHPMDLVLQDPEGEAVNIVGIAGDTEVWAGRIREEAARFQKSIGEKSPPELDIRTAGSWPRDTETAKLHAALLEALSARMTHV